MQAREDPASVPHASGRLHPMGPDEEILAGGLGNEGRVVRVGNTVRRPIGPQTPAVHLLLRHLEQVGFDGAPRVVDRIGDLEVLSFLPGAVAVPPFPRGRLATSSW